MYSRSLQLSSRLRDQRGIALPLSLLALIVVTLIVTGVLLTSTTEVALSHAHQDATRNLYIAEAGLYSYVARIPITGAATVTHTPYFRPAEEAATIQIERMLSAPFGTNTPQDTTFIYSLTSRPAGGGRGVTAQVQIDRMAMRTFASDIQSALTCDSCDAGGDTQISNGSDGVYCNPADSVNNAVLHADSGNFESGGSSVIRGSVEQSSLGAAELFESVLGAPIRDVAFAADLKFGTIFNEPEYTGTNASSVKKIQGQNIPAVHTKFNWGCPGAMDTKDNCGAAPYMDTTYAPIVAIDAQGGQVNINGDHGQGMLIVINGDLKVNGNFLYKGIIVSEGSIFMGGAGGNQGGAKIEGAVIAAGSLEFAEDDSQATGNSVIRYNKCAIDLVTESFNSKPDRYGAPTIRGRPFGWFEVVR